MWCAGGLKTLGEFDVRWVVRGKEGCEEGQKGEQQDKQAAGSDERLGAKEGSPAWARRGGDVVGRWFCGC